MSSVRLAATACLAALAFPVAAQTALGSGFTLGAQLGYEEGRKASESSLLRERNVADLGAGASYGMHAEWETKLGAAPVLLLARVRQQVRSDRGAQADLRATIGVYKNGPFQAGIFGQATWANHKSMRTYYGQPGFDASGGLLFASIGLLGSYDIDPRWAVIGSIEGRRLQVDETHAAAVNSTVVRIENFPTRVLFPVPSQPLQDFHADDRRVPQLAAAFFAPGIGTGRRRGKHGLHGAFELSVDLDDAHQAVDFPCAIAVGPPQAGGCRWLSKGGRRDGDQRREAELDNPYRNDCLARESTWSSAVAARSSSCSVISSDGASVMTFL